MGLGLGFGIGGRAAAVGGREERGVVARDGVCTAEQRGTSLLGSGRGRDIVRGRARV